MPLEPCLLDRLADDGPGNPSEGNRVSLERYRSGVLRDLIWLFNSSAHQPFEGNSDLNLAHFPHAQHSVINFGIRQLFGSTSPDIPALTKGLNTALNDFEPRLIRNTLQVRARQEGHLIALEIQGQLWGTPIQQLRLKTLLDVENGHCSLGS
jgi:type VI secretion system protein ImpF